MDLASGTALNLGHLPHRFSSCSFPFPQLQLQPTSPASRPFFIGFWPNYQRHSPVYCAKKKESTTRFVPKEIIFEEEEVGNTEGEGALGGVEDEEEEVIEDLGDEILADDTEGFEDDFVDEDDCANPQVGDGGGGGGISLAGTWWDQKALTLAEEVSQSFNGDLKIYAFKTLANSSIRVRIEKMSCNCCWIKRSVKELCQMIYH
ncbi:hypothetical protein AXF42_Ash000385 [Apostasia shenzhenica]|uniref:Uncharacterized protein n=1 Tax=Apostasia shenzhenica TaxID=1088818 RepID=A0A2I0AG74_9ASPA|nr:hypothetical protein AXF42_Ash000385 [Apostasia shenzhenica]